MENIKNQVDMKNQIVELQSYPNLSTAQSLVSDGTQSDSISFTCLNKSVIITCPLMQKKNKLWQKHVQLCQKKSMIRTCSIMPKNQSVTKVCLMMPQSPHCTSRPQLRSYFHNLWLRSARNTFRPAASCNILYQYVIPFIHTHYLL